MCSRAAGRASPRGRGRKQHEFQVQSCKFQVRGRDWKVVVARLAVVNVKRLLRSRGLKLVFVVLPFAIALLRIVFTHSKPILRAAEFCPILCILLLGIVLYSQWSMDAARGLIAGLRSTPVSSRGILVSRVLSGALILLVQMVVFVGILAVRF